MRSDDCIIVLKHVLALLSALRGAHCANPFALFNLCCCGAVRENRFDIGIQMYPEEIKIETSMHRARNGTDGHVKGCSG